MFLLLYCVFFFRRITMLSIRTVPRIIMGHRVRIWTVHRSSFSISWESPIHQQSILRVGNNPSTWSVRNGNRKRHIQSGMVWCLPMLSHPHVQVLGSHDRESSVVHFGSALNSFEHQSISIICELQLYDQFLISGFGERGGKLDTWKVWISGQRVGHFMFGPTPSPKPELSV